MSDGFTSTVDATAARFTSKLGQFATLVQQQGSLVVKTHATGIREAIIRTSPVDTRFLQAHWSPAHQRGDPLTWGISTDVPYAPTLEYGGYHGIGKRMPPRTVRLGGGDLGAGFTAGAGIYSTQAPLGWIRKALAQAQPQYLLRLQNMLREAWARASTTGTTGGLAAVGVAPASGRALALTPAQLGTLFGIDVI